eukprot:maker-scaffold_14-augustus-gene-4.12-mRNA-1 protein AED:0.33 eAED:0.34 QI:0/0/0/1/0/0/2/0/418
MHNKLVILVGLASLGLTVSAETSCVNLYSQCGGYEWTEATNCCEGSVCIVSDAYYSQCRPGNEYCANTYEQCGGSSWTGATKCCDDKNKCYKKDEYYSQCIPNEPTMEPTKAPTKYPTVAPSSSPTYPIPTKYPTKYPSQEPTKYHYFMLTFKSSLDVQSLALKEFNALVAALQEKAELEILVVEDEHGLPESIFPNNWISFHKEFYVLYPMYSNLRRNERKNLPQVLITSKRSESKAIDLTNWEEKNMFLEGTGSMVLHRGSKVGFCCLSKRSDQEVIEVFEKETGFRIFTFTSIIDETKVYHTNVVMSIGIGFCVICMESISDVEERKKIQSELESLDLRIIEITIAQVKSFCGNILQVGSMDKKYLVLSKSAMTNFTKDQTSILEELNDGFITANLEIIERVGGGGIRCCIAEIF